MLKLRVQRFLSLKKTPTDLKGEENHAFGFSTGGVTGHPQKVEIVLQEFTDAST